MDTRAQELKEKGNQAFSEERNEDAIRLYSQALELGPNAILYSNRAAAYLKLAKNAAALADAEAAIRLDPSYVKAYLRKGSALMAQNKLDEARIAFEAGLYVDPSSAVLKGKMEELKSIVMANAANMLASSFARGNQWSNSSPQALATVLMELPMLTSTYRSSVSKELARLLAGPVSDGAENEVRTKLAPTMSSIVKVLKTMPSVRDCLDAVDMVVATFWGVVAEHTALTSITTEMLAASGALSSMMELLQSASSVFGGSSGRKLKRGGRILAATITSAFVRPPDAEREAKLISLLGWFAERCKAEPLMLPDPWGARDSLENKHPMMAAILVGTPALVSFVASKGVSLGGASHTTAEGSPLSAAYRRGRADNFSRLLDLGATSGATAALLASFLKDFKQCACFPGQNFAFGTVCHHDHETGLREARLAMIDDMLKRRPGLLKSDPRAPVADLAAYLIANGAAETGDVALLELVLGLGAKISFTGRSTLEAAIAGRAYKVVELLVTKYKAAERNSQYDGSTLRRLAEAVAVSAVTAYPRNPKFEGPASEVIGPVGLKIADLILKSGLKASWNQAGSNSLLSQLYCGQKHCLLSEQHTIEVLERFRTAGWNVTSVVEKDARDDGGSALLVMAASKGQVAVVDYAIEKAGCSVDEFYINSQGNPYSPLLLAVITGDKAMAQRLLTKHKARAAYPDRSLFLQPLHAVLNGSKYTDAEALPLLRLMIANSPELLELDCYKEKGTPGQQGAEIGWTPVWSCVSPPKPKCLELLLTTFPAAKKMACQRITGEVPSGLLLQDTALHFAVAQCSWECATLLLTHSNASVTERLTYGDASSGPQRYRPSAFEGLQAAMSGPKPPPRGLVAAFVTAGKRESDEADRKRGHSCSSAGPCAFCGCTADERLKTNEGLTTNAFEMPADADGGSGAGAGARGKNKGSKQKSGKKKASKGKKKKQTGATSEGKSGAASSGGSAQDIDGEDTSEDDEEAFEEPDDNLVDSRYAPSLDVMLAERERERQKAAGKSTSDKA